MGQDHTLYRYRRPSGKSDAGRNAREVRVAFDFYNTLVQVGHAAPAPWQVLRDLGYDSHESDEHIWNSDGFDGTTTPSGQNYCDWRRHNLGQWAAFAGVRKADRARVVRRMLEVDRSWTVRAAPRCHDALALLEDHGVRYGICSNFDYDLLPYLEQAGIPSTTPRVLSWEVGARKPHDRMFDAIAHELGAPRANVVFVGDSLRCDVIGAIRAGMSPIWLAGDESHPLVRRAMVSVCKDLPAACKLILSGGTV